MCGGSLGAADAVLLPCSFWLLGSTLALPARIHLRGRVCARRTALECVRVCCLRARLSLGCCPAVFAKARVRYITDTK